MGQSGRRRKEEQVKEEGEREDRREGGMGERKGRGGRKEEGRREGEQEGS